MVIGIVLVLTTSWAPAAYILSMGLFGFAGGITNWLAVYMLFERVPGLYGSGVIPNQFQQIRAALKDMVQRAFFDRQFLSGYLGSRGKQLMAEHMPAIQAKIQEVMDKPETDQLIAKQLQDAAAAPGSSVAMLIQMAAMATGGDISALATQLKPVLAGFAVDAVAHLADALNPQELINVDAVIAEVNTLMTEKLRLLTADHIKQLLEQVIREHLGWLVVWGNVFGGLIGLVSQAAGFGYMM